MRGDRLKRLARSGVGAFSLLLIQGFLAPNLARAGCNHLVTSRFDSSLDINRLGEWIAAPSAPASADDPVRYPVGPRPPRRQTPCSGMNCSSRVPLPISTVSPEPRNIDQWGNLSAPRALEPGRALNREVEQPHLDQRGYKPSIFHPPPR